MKHQTLFSLNDRSKNKVSSAASFIWHFKDYKWSCGHFTIRHIINTVVDQN